ncbi:hypothetical protein KBW71_00060 [Hydrogenophaga aromaticivorans]|uniref:hypothetical protein n=1 Tax=Hydrogenophaga aromaticivorans TaxID=2610898 RepID=UPI001B36781F|nr:hypothetical protein [Hydrogenophaga aromaticivorans]MBQ0916842.1 hypothetical protein [Hydrogenophaga aromaticivorans]MBU4337833.1 hypothetical protein [Actinomycetota bacterium]
MNVEIRVTQAELAEMETTASELSESVQQVLLGGLQTEDGTLYLSSVNVDVQVAE